MKKKTYKSEERWLVGELFAVAYYPEWAKKYPEWLNKILFWIFNYIRFTRRFERYL